MSLFSISVNSFKETDIIPLENNELNGNILEIADDNGYVLALFKNGNINTKNFESHRSSLIYEDSSEADLNIGDSEGNVILQVKNGHIKTKNFDSSGSVGYKKLYIDCLGDSLTAGFDNSGYWVNTLLELLGNDYTVRNWGVGGEAVPQIMVRQGSDSVILSNSFVLPMNSTDVAMPTFKDCIYNTNISLLLLGSSSTVNPCYIKGIECTLKLTSGNYYIKRNSEGDRNVTISPNEPILFNTGKCMGDAYVSIIWMGTNGVWNTEADMDELIEQQRKSANHTSNKNFIVIGLHCRITKQLGEYYENKMRLAFGNKFFNIREYCCTNILYDAGITPTASDLTNMSNGICPSSALYDSVHFKPATNVCIAHRIYEMMIQLGYIN